MESDSNISNTCNNGNMGQGMYFDFQAVAWRNIDLPWIEWLQWCYPDVDVNKELTRRMPVWLLNERKGKGRKKRWDRFIVKWLTRAQRRAEREVIS